MKPLLFALAALAAGSAAAQTQPDPATAGAPAPSRAEAPAPALVYRSTFADYRTFAEEEQAPGDWRKANEEVRAAGGPAGHRPGQGKGEPGSKPQPQKPEASGGHGGHHR